MFNGRSRRFEVTSTDFPASSYIRKHRPGVGNVVTCHLGVILCQRVAMLVGVGMVAAAAIVVAVVVVAEVVVVVVVVVVV